MAVPSKIIAAHTKIALKKLLIIVECWRNFQLGNRKNYMGVL